MKKTCFMAGDSPIWPTVMNPVQCTYIEPLNPTETRVVLNEMLNNQSESR